MRLTEAEYASLLEQGKVQEVPPPGPPRPASRVQSHRPNPHAPYRSRLEARYAALLVQQERAGLIRRWRYEAIRLRLAPATTLTVDFAVTMSSLQRGEYLALHEVKGGYVREDGWQKLKIAAALYPEFEFMLVRWVKLGIYDTEGYEWQWKVVPAV
jgi:hypothetical protein